MRRVLWFLPFGALVLAGGVMGYRYGWIAANMTETAAIEAYAARYVRDYGGQMSDCLAVPGARVWLEVRCGAGDALVVYEVNRLGGLVREGRGVLDEAGGPKT